MGALDELAAQYVPKGLAWGAIEGSAGGLLESNGYVFTMEQRQAEYFAVMTTLDVELTRELSARDAMESYDLTKTAAVAAAPAALDAIAIGLGVVSADDALRVRLEPLEQLLVLVDAVTWSSYSAHYSGVARWLVERGEMSLEEAKRDASATYALWSGVIELDRLGVLDPLKRRGQRGTGAVQVPVVIAIAVVVAIAAIAWLIVTLVEGSRRADFMDRSCFDEEGKPRAADERPPYCDEYGKNLAENPNGHLAVLLGPLTSAVGGITTALGVALAIGAAILAGGYVLPRVLQATATVRRPSPRRLGGAPRGALGA